MYLKTFKEMLGRAVKEIEILERAREQMISFLNDPNCEGSWRFGDRWGEDNLKFRAVYIFSPLSPSSSVIEKFWSNSFASEEKDLFRPHP